MSCRDFNSRPLRPLLALASKGLPLSLCLLLMGMGFPPQAIAQPAKKFCKNEEQPAIIYSGKTYGYLRDNDSSSDSIRNAFITTYKEIVKECPQAILVGMGDNFAPDYRSRYYIDKQKNPLKPITISRTDPNGPSNSPAVQFFRDHNYNALVPGQLDFYFGASFLWYVDPGLPMLGVNLVIKSTTQETPAPSVCGQPQLLLPTQVSLPPQSGSGSSGGGKGKSGGKKGGGGGSGQGSSASSSSSSQSGSGQSGQLCLQTSSSGGPSLKGGLTLVTPSSDSVYPWSTEFAFSLSKDSKALLDYPVLCPWKPARLDQKTAGESTVECINLESPKPAKKSETEKADGGAAYVTRILDNDDILIGKDGLPRANTKGRRVLFPGANVQLCLRSSDAKSFLACTNMPIPVQVPFFSRAWVQVPKKDTGYALNYAIFGVLDPALQGLISPENFSWGSDDKYTTQISIPDPASALEQLLTAFRRLHEADDTLWTYVLLAQMQRAEAQALSATLQWHYEHLSPELKTDHLYHFDAILAAGDYDEATPGMELTLDQWSGEQPRRPIRPTPVIAPRPIVTEDQRYSPLAVLDVDESDSIQTKYTNHIFATSVACDKYDHIRETLDTASLVELQKDFRKGEEKEACKGNNSFQCLTLRTMQKQLDADAAILQRRDFYYQCNYEGPTKAQQPEPIDEMVQRVLWNSGYLTRASVSGATLKAILQASDKQAVLEKSSTYEPLSRNRDLVYVGITKAYGLYYVDGVALEDSKIYSIATSDQVALGDNAYPQFAQADLVVPTVFTGRDKQTFAIADLTSAALATAALTPLVRADIVTAGLTVPPPLRSPKEPGPSQNPFEKSNIKIVGQDRNFLTITLQQMSAGYTNSKPSQTDANINTNLAGVTNPNVASPHSDSQSYSDSFRLLYQWRKHVDFGLDQILTYTRTRTGSLTASAQITTTGQPVPPESLNLSANTLIASPFLEFQFLRSQPHWKAVIRPVTFSTGLSRTLQFLPTKPPSNPPPPPNTPSVVYELNLKRQENWQPSVGIRYEWNNLTFFETGYLDQSARNVLAALTVNDKTTPLTAGKTVSQITNVVPNQGDVAIPIYKTFRQQGAYWLGMWTQPLTRNLKAVKITYQGITYGNFLAYGAVDRTSTILTRYAAQLNNSLQIQLWGNVSFGPSYNIFWFQDQSHGPGSSLTRRDWNLLLNYSFDWHEGLEWKDVLEGKTGQ